MGQAMRRMSRPLEDLIKSVPLGEHDHKTQKAHLSDALDLNLDVVSAAATCNDALHPTMSLPVTLYRPPGYGPSAFWAPSGLGACAHAPRNGLGRGADVREALAHFSRLPTQTQGRLMSMSPRASARPPILDVALDPPA